eukprot:g7407.t1
MHDRAGALYERMGLIQPAMDAYCRGHAYRQAIELAKHSQPGLVVALEEQWGDWLVSQRQVDAAINHYIEAGSAIKAIDAAMNLGRPFRDPDPAAIEDGLQPHLPPRTARQWHKAEMLLDQVSMGADQTFALPFYEKLATHYGQSRQFDQAERAFIKSGRPQRAVQMYVDHAQYEKAHRAEQMYLAVNEFDLAINMYKKREEYEQMLRLVSKYRKDHMSQQYEMKGNLKKAEHYYVEAKMWTSAMSMYRQLEQWEDAKRVAKMHGGKQALEKVVLAQAHATFKEHGAEAGAQLLAKHGLIDIAIDYAVEHSNFAHAFELANLSAKHKLPDIHLKKALALEDDEQFKLAEEEFIQAKKPKEAIDMYVHQRDWVSAMRVAEAYEPQSVNDVMVHHAKDLVDQNNMQAAENLFIQAGKPELAVKAYSAKRNVPEAVRVCKKHCPHMLGDVVDSYGEGGGAPGVAQSRRPTAGQDTGSYSRAIDTYLSVSETSSADADRLEEVWENAVRLSMKHAQERYNEVVSIVAKRLKLIQRFEAAAELYESVDHAREAVNCYMAGEAGESFTELSRLVEERYKSELVNKGDGDHVIRMTGDVDTALDMYARNGEWTKCLTLAEKQSPKILPHYLVQYCKILANKGDNLEACQMLVRYGPPTDPGQSNSNFQLYKVIHGDLLAGDQPAGPPLAEFLKALMASHLMTIRERLRERHMAPELVAKISLSLCRYCSEFPMDLAFYSAGLDCKEAGMINMSFFFLNRFLDIADAIDDPETLERKQTWIFQIKTMSRVRRWRKSATGMDLRQCDKCGHHIYGGSLICTRCGTQNDPCAVTGFPVLKKSRVECTVCHVAANRDDWNIYVQQFKDGPRAGRSSSVQEAPRSLAEAADRWVKTLWVILPPQELKKLVKHREDIGVTLYGAQQQLAKLQLQLEQLHDKYAMCQGQRLEERERRAAMATLREASREMEAIQFEKKQLMMQWRSSLVGMQRRDEALENVQKALEEQSEAELAIENEIRGLHASIRTEQELALSSLGRTTDVMDMNLKQEREKLMDQYTTLNKSMDEHSEETQKLKGALTEQTRSLEEIAAKEVETQNLLNEIARVTVDSLNTKAHNQMLKDRHKQLSDELAEREKLIEQYEQEIRKRHHQIEKKQLFVDRLNREYDEKRRPMLHRWVDGQASCHHSKH